MNCEHGTRTGDEAFVCWEGGASDDDDDDDDGDDDNNDDDDDDDERRAQHSLRYNRSKNASTPSKIYLKKI